MATQAQIAEHLDLSERRVRDMIGEGVLQKGADLAQCRISYIRHLRDGASGQQTGAGLKLTDERARLAKLQADKVEPELAELRRELVRAENAAKVMVSHIIAARARLLALSTKLVTLFRVDAGRPVRTRGDIVSSPDMLHQRLLTHHARRGTVLQALEICRH